VLVSGSSVYDIRDCRKPVLLGEIAWPPLGIKGIPQQPERGDTCQPYPRPTALAWGFEVLAIQPRVRRALGI